MLKLRLRREGTLPGALLRRSTFYIFDEAQVDLVDIQVTISFKITDFCIEPSVALAEILRISDGVGIIFYFTFKKEAASDN